MKKFFSLVLALAMALSLTTIAWGAAVAKIGSDEYASLQDAIDAAEAANTVAIVIDLLDDATLDVTAWETLAIGSDVTTSITINGNNNTLTFNQLNSDWNNIATKNGAKLIINNAHLTNSGHNNGPWNRHDLNFACDVELNNVTSDKAMAFKADATLNTVTINDANTSATYAIWVQPNGQTITLNNCTIDMEACSDGRGIKIDEQYLSAPAKVALNVSETSFTTDTKAAIVVKSAAGADIVASDCDISGVAEDSANLVWVDEDAAASAKLVSVTGATGKVEGSTGHVAQLNGVKYTTLAEAVAAAADGDTVVMMANSAEDITLTKVITIDTNGFAYTGTLKAPANYQVVKNTAGEYVVTAAVTFADKYDLYLADKTMNAMLALEKPAVSGLAFNEVGANTNLDGSGNVAYIVANNGEYYVKTTTPTTESYAVTYAGKTTVLYYVDVADVQNANAFAYAGSATAFDKFSTFDKCGYVTVAQMPAATDVYFQTAAGAALNVAYKAAATTGTDVTKNYLLDGEVVTVATTVPVVDHKFVASGYKYDTVKKINVPTSALCTKCLETSSVIYKDGKVPAGTKYYELWDGNNTTDYSVVATVAPVGGAVVTPSTDKVTSAETFDAGIAMYVGMSVMAAAGSAVVIGKKKD